MRRATALLLLLFAACPAAAVLDTAGFRAVAVALGRNPISALAVTPDGRLFAAMQGTEQTTGTTAGTAEIRVFSGYQQADGSLLEEGGLWATLDGIRATSIEEGLLGIALAPDFATSKLVYVHVTTTEESANQHVRVYRERADGTGEYLGTVQTGLEPPAEQAARSGGHLTFGADGCLYVGMGDNGSRWNAQLVTGTDPVGGTEAGTLCTDVCAGSAEWPSRPGATNDGRPNLAGKVLRLAVEGASTAQGGPAPPVPGESRVFAGGLRNPTGLLAHPLTGQLWVTDRGDTLEAEVTVAESGSNHGWPCVEGTRINTTAAACLTGQTADDVHARHPTWRRPAFVHAGSGVVVTGLAASTGLGYPAEFYGDVFYLVRDSARIYRADLAPPCFLAPTATAAPLVFHDSASDGDFRAIYDADGDGDFDNVSFSNLTAIVEAPDPMGQKVLYVAGRQNNGSDMRSDSAIFRIEYATAFAPYAGPTGRVPDSCFAGIENPFARPRCMAPGGPCPGQPDGMACGDGDACNGSESCLGGICHATGVLAADGTACGEGAVCRSGGTCQGGVCSGGAPLPDGTSCADADPCNGRETCAAGACAPGSGPESLSVGSVVVKPSGALTLRGGLPGGAVPGDGQSLALTLTSGDTTLAGGDLGAPGAPPRRRQGGGILRWRRPGKGDGFSLVELRAGGGGTALQAKGRASALRGSTLSSLGVRVVAGDRCFAGQTACRPRGRGLRCGS